ncbi:MAG: NAD(P)-dependent oxidoreductase [Ignavibacteriaceae bacterium]|jgi:UDP-glucose 4-epimerase
MKAKIIAVTGSSGFLGKPLVQKLQNDGYQVIEIDLSNKIDITNKDSLKDIQRFDIIIHLAAKSFVPDSYIFPFDYYFINSIGTLNILELCRKFKAKIIFISSYVYGQPQYLPVDEKHPLQPFNPYSQSKIIGEHLCIGYNRDFDIPVIVIRPFNIYGENQPEHFLISKIISQAKHGKVILNDLRPRRDYIYIDDIIDLFLLTLEYENYTFENFNASYGKSYSVKEVVDIVKEISRFNFDVINTHSTRKEEVLEVIGNSDKAKHILKWYPNYDLREGIMRIFNKKEIR